jgi:peptide/nickel transport system permease protein
MHWKLIAGSFGVLVVLVMLGSEAILPLQDATAIHFINILAPPSQRHFLGTDELGRDLLARFIGGTKYTILTGLVTTLISIALGAPLGLAAHAAPAWLGRFIVILAYVCFVFPRFMLSSSWLSRWLMAVACTLAILPIPVFVVTAVGIWDWVGWVNAFALGSLFAVAVAYTIRAGYLHEAGSAERIKNWPPQLSALVPSVFFWSVCSHISLDIMGLGVQPPGLSWGSTLIARSGSWWPNIITGLSLVTLGFIAFALSDGMTSGKARRSASQVSQ